MSTQLHCPNCGAEVALSHPGGENLSERQTGWRAGIAATWRAIEHLAVAGTADNGVRECRRRIEALGNKGPPENIA